MKKEKKKIRISIDKELLDVVKRISKEEQMSIEDTLVLLVRKSVKTFLSFS